MKIRNLKVTFLILIMATLFTNCKKDDDTKSSCFQNENALTLVHDDEIREYILYVPSSYNELTSVPLVLNFHGFGGIATDYMNYADMRLLSESEGFILAYPQGSCLNGSSHWNPSLPSSDNKSNADDFGFVEALINQLSTSYAIDSERIYACGYSNGAMLSYALACYKSDLIAAIGSVSGTMLDSDCTPSHPVPMINIHGTSDSVLPYNGSSDYSSVEVDISRWTTINNTNLIPVINTENNNGVTIDHYTYSGGDNDTSVEHYKIVDGNHVWFDVNYQGNNTSNLLWNFMSKYDINGLR